MKGRALALLTSLAITGAAHAGSLEGEVQVSGSDRALPDARIRVVGTTLEARAGRDGTFKLPNVPDGTWRVEVSAPGYLPVAADVEIKEGTAKLAFELVPAAALSETIIITANRAQVRDSPVAFTNVTGDEIAEKYTTQDTPQLLEGVPGVFSRSAGLGESDLLIRGMDAEHVQIMINNVPVNDPESQVVYWSNWTGLSGNAADIQVQRGVGTSLLGSGAFGGSVNIETNNFSRSPHASFDATYGLVRQWAGNYIIAADANTGDMGPGDKLNFYVRYERKAGESYIEGTRYNGHSFYTGLQFVPNAHHTLTFNFHGAPQEHRQAGNVQDPTLLEEFGRTWNRRDHPYQVNYFFKPVLEAHHDWIISPTAVLNTTAFATMGNGGGAYLRNDHVNLETGEIESLPGGTFSSDRNYDAGTIYNNSFKNDSQNDHIQFGLNTAWSKLFGPRLTIVAGGETRIWRAHHYAESLEFEFGDEGDGKGAETVAEVERRYDYDGAVNMGALFLRALISPVPDRLTIMLDGQGSAYSQSVDENPILQYDFYNRRFTDIEARATQDLITDWDASGEVTTATVVANPDADPDLYHREFYFFQPKAGVNFNVTKGWNVFGNYSIAKKEPKVGDWYFRSGVPASAEEQQISAETLQDAEVGFGYRSERQALTVNGYRMAFMDKITSITDSNGDRQTLNAGNAVHRGVELGYRLVIIENLSVKASVSLMDNRWVEMNSEVDEIFGTPVEDIVGKHVPGAPQRQAYGELAWDGERFSAFISDSYWDRYYVLYDNSQVDGLQDDGTLPAYNELGLGVSYTHPFGEGRSVRARVIANNLLGQDNYVDASYSRDYGRDGEYYLGVTQAPLRTVFGTVSLTF